MLFEIKSSEITVDTQEQKKILAADTRRQTQTLPTGLSALRVSCPSGKGQGLPWAGHGQRQMGRAGPVSFTRNSSKHFRVKTPPFFATGPHERTQTGTSNRTAGRPIKCWIPQNSHHTERVKCASFTQKCSKQFWVKDRSLLPQIHSAKASAFAKSYGETPMTGFLLRFNKSGAASTRGRRQIKKII